jgi:hypothetical protein
MSRNLGIYNSLDILSTSLCKSNAQSIIFSKSERSLQIMTLQDYKMFRSGIEPLNIILRGFLEEGRGDRRRASFGWQSSAAERAQIVGVTAIKAKLNDWPISQQELVTFPGVVEIRRPMSHVPDKARIPLAPLRKR